MSIHSCAIDSFCNTNESEGEEKGGKRTLGPHWVRYCKGKRPLRQPERVSGVSEAQSLCEM